MLHRTITRSADLSAASVAVASMAGQVGADGGWAVLYGTDAVTATRLQLAVDEDSKLDAERAHTTESMSYLVFQDTALQLDGTAAPQRTRAELTLDAVQQLVQRAIALWDADDDEWIWTVYRCRSATCRVSSWHRPRKMD